MKLKNQYPACDCNEEHYIFTCKCENSAFNINASKKIICTECGVISDLSKVLAMVKDKNHYDKFMNDFTQEELILIACWSISRFMQVGDEQAKEEGTIALCKKIQDMIIYYGLNK